jgi:uncharacterized protein (DUF1778 family)
VGPKSALENKDQRLEVRMTQSERKLINSAATELGGDLSSFVVASLVDASRRVMADRSEFSLSPAEKTAWEAINRRPAADLAGLRELMQRPSPFID